MPELRSLIPVLQRLPALEKRDGMNTIVLDSDVVRIPDWVEDLDSFRRWMRCEEFPESGRICYLDGEIWVDMSKEQIFSHNQVKNEFNIVVGGLVKQARIGRYFPDGLLITNPEANLVSRPDGAFVSQAALQSGRVRLIAGAQGGYVELEGSPDMTLEVVSTSSVEKDTVILPDLYWQSGILEYWLVDARGKSPRFDILRRRPKGYVTTRGRAGWLKSSVFAKSFRLTQRADPLGHPDFTLEVR